MNELDNLLLRLSPEAAEGLVPAASARQAARDAFELGKKLAPPAPARPWANRPDPRPDWEEFAFENARTYSLRGNCTRRQVGAVIVTPDFRQVAQGYNGAPPGEDGCLSHGACPRGRHYATRANGTSYASTADRPWPACACGKLWPCEDSVPPGSSYDTGKGTCSSVHAEQNAILDAGTKAAPIKGCRMYVTEEPCDGCVRLCRGAQLAGVMWPGGQLLF